MGQVYPWHVSRDASTGKATWGRDDQRTYLGCTMKKGSFADGKKDSGSGDGACTGEGRGQSQSRR